jgi:hypothetical protein
MLEKLHSFVLSRPVKRANPRLIIATITEPYAVDDILGVIDRQAAEGTWAYAMLYDLRGATHLNTEAEAQQSPIASQLLVQEAREAR